MLALLKTTLLQAVVTLLSLRGTGRERQLLAVGATIITSVAVSPSASQTPPAQQATSCPTPAEVWELLAAEAQENMCWKITPPTMMFTLLPSTALLAMHACLLQAVAWCVGAIAAWCQQRWQRTQQQELATIRAFLRAGCSLQKLAATKELTPEELVLLLLQ